jgi:hypothetical protein
MDIPKQREQSAEECIGSMIGKIIVLALIAFFVWGYASTLAAKLGVPTCNNSGSLAIFAAIRRASSLVSSLA